MKILLFISEAVIPLLLFYVVGLALLQKQNVYHDFIEGSKRGIQTVIEIMPTLIGLMVAVGVLRASGFLDALASWLGKLPMLGAFPADLLPLSLVKMFSSSAATGLLLDIYKEHGTDSYIGLSASLILSSTETIFYTMSIYFMSVKIKKTRYTLWGALFASIVGILVSVWIATYL